MTPATRERPGAVADTWLEVPAMKKHTVSERFWEKVDLNGPLPKYNPGLGPCWLWTGTTRGRGYGYLEVDGRKRAPAHRWSYTSLIGPVPLGLDLDHLCRVITCVNPHYLEPVTRSENIRRGFRSRRGVFSQPQEECLSPRHNGSQDFYYTKQGRFICRPCRNANERRRYHKRSNQTNITNEREAQDA